MTKLAANTERDRRNVAKLLSLNWRVIVVWECSTKASSATTVVEAIRPWLASTGWRQLAVEEGPTIAIRLDTDASPEEPFA